MKYLAYWSMTDNPFRKDIEIAKLTHTQDFTYAVQNLNFLREYGGVGLLTGKPGNGKTTIIRYFIDSLPNGLYKPVYVKLSTVGVSEFYKMLARGLKLEPSRFKSENFEQIQSKLSTLKNNDKLTPIIVLDEAHYLCKEILIELPILLNFRYDSQHCANLLLVGSPILNTRLQMEQFEALNDRIIANYNIEGITLQETRELVSQRLKDVNVCREIFEENAITAAHSASKGSMRKLFNILTKSLMVACTNQANTVNLEAVHDAVEQVRLESS